MGLNRGSVVLVEGPTGKYEGWVFKDNYEQDGRFKGKTITVKTKKEKLTFNWSDIYRVVLQWDASDKSYNNTDYVGDEIKGGATEKKTSYRNFKSSSEQQKASAAFSLLIEEALKEFAILESYGLKLLAGMGIGGAGLVYNLAYAPRGYEWFNFVVLPIIWAGVELQRISLEAFDWKDTEWNARDMKDISERRGRRG